jgi:hypothetical protein
VLRLAGLWVLWGVWCQWCGWGLSAFHQLSGGGYLLASPALVLPAWLWLQAANGPSDFSGASRWRKWRRRFSRPLPFFFLLIAALSLGAALIHLPWSFDAVSYRLPRILYWWSARHWYWIGTLDHRLDYSGTGFEWQMLPVILLTHTDRLIFLLSWLPFLLMPGLVFAAFRLLGVSGRSARRWMWLLPAGFCFALQCSGLQNDGYMVGYTLAAMIFAGLAYRRRQLVFFWLALLAGALLTGAKLSNLPLLLPLGLLLLPVLGRVRWLGWRTLLVVILAAGGSFLPLAFLCWKHTGDWTGDPLDQSNVHPRNHVGALVANALAFANDVAQPPVFPPAKKLNARLAPLNQLPFMQWLRWAHPNSEGLVFGNAAYEGQAGLGCGLGWYLLFLLLGLWFIRPPPAARPALPWAWRLAPWTAWLSLTVLLAEIAFTHITRYAAPYYPLLVVSLLSLPRVVALERKKIAGLFAGAAMLAVVPVILFTPARPVFPVEPLARILHRRALQTFAAQYHYWAVLRDDLAPLRAQLPPAAKKLGYACGFRDTSYGLWQPFGSRVVEELGLPLGSHRPPPPDIQYAVVNENGLQARYGQTLPAWLAATHGEVIAELDRSPSLVASGPVKYDRWYLVRFDR